MPSRLVGIGSPFLKTRHLEPELMDQPGLDAAAHRHALAGLARVNWWSRSAAIFWPALTTLGNRSSADAAQQSRPVRVLDLACGGGDVTVALAQRALKSGLKIEFTGLDISETALEVSRERARQAGVVIDFQQHDVLQSPLPEGFDAIICSLFLHHLAESDAIALLGRMAAAARQVVLVNDLIRSRSGYWLAVLGTKLLTRSHIVHVDGPLSVAGAFTIGEVRDMAKQAGLSEPTIRRHWPWRFLMTWSRS